MSTYSRRLVVLAVASLQRAGSRSDTIISEMRQQQESVQQAMQPFLAEHYGNPSSSHALGRAAHEAVEDARSQVAGLIGADREEVGGRAISLLGV